MKLGPGSEIHSSATGCRGAATFPNIQYSQCATFVVLDLNLSLQVSI